MEMRAGNETKVVRDDGEVRCVMQSPADGLSPQLHLSDQSFRAPLSRKEIRPRSPDPGWSVRFRRAGCFKGGLDECVTEGRNKWVFGGARNNIPPAGATLESRLVSLSS